MNPQELAVTEQPISKSEVILELEGGSHSKQTSHHDRISILDKYDYLIVKEETDVTGAVCSCCACCDKLQMYTIKDKEGKTIFTATEGFKLLKSLLIILIWLPFLEDPWCCDCTCCKSCRRGRKFEMKIVDDEDNEVIHLHMPRPCRCFDCCVCCIYQVN